MLANGITYTTESNGTGAYDIRALDANGNLVDELRDVSCKRGHAVAIVHLYNEKGLPLVCLREMTAHLMGVLL